MAMNQFDKLKLKKCLTEYQMQQAFDQNTTYRFNRPEYKRGSCSNDKLDSVKIDKKSDDKEISGSKVSSIHKKKMTLVEILSESERLVRGIENNEELNRIYQVPLNFEEKRDNDSNMPLKEERLYFP